MTPTESIISEIHRERERQYTHKWHSNEEDDKHTEGQLAKAASCYAAGETVYRIDFLCYGRDFNPKPSIKDLWPWAGCWWNPKTRRDDLIRAAALIVAEIERLDRAVLLQETQE